SGKEDIRAVFIRLIDRIVVTKVEEVSSVSFTGSDPSRPTAQGRDIVARAIINGWRVQRVRIPGGPPIANRRYSRLPIGATMKTLLWFCITRSSFQIGNFFRSGVGG